ncbi:putative NADPH-dependent FMN reductase [Alloactinosynnema sp. L-07]|uniref:NADPH-dependent FMN reductase n=1 Tax=Alloactinosynnema sp. L-07 TaxID=1653480 RepID=UPI00065F024E|nr:NAD(P)H-dependent oxidoreductase [Alloactinosynnema sp. L-07]CRK55117.1 putative NADPH-dependent FMN reductase [Alloactinosynnema sp. L-07]
MELALVGGSLRPGSVSERVLRACADLAAEHGARSTVLTAEDLDLPLYRPGSPHRAARELLSALRRADGVIIATPTYHGGVSGLLKNALDYVEDLAGDTPAYLDGRVVGTVAVGWSEHGAATAVAELRTAVLCLRGWVTPMAVTVNSVPLSTLDGLAADAALRSDARLMRRLEILVGQVVDFAGTRLVTAV